ncbi:MAG: ATP-binding cassette domain-containing protein [Gammaproteobacteria bacterium]|nr:ATP-binding cassette domain-containing protein [Gammaproteobacteria bacterium]
MINLDQISLRRGPHLLLEDVSLTLHRGERTGVVGRNGCGKTSLFRALGKEIPLDHGEIRAPADLRWSTMSQETPGSDRLALDFVIDAHSEYRKLEAVLARAERLEDNDAMASLHSRLEAIHGYDIQNRAEQLLSGLGFSTTEFDTPVSNFSGGWRVRLNLAAALMCPSDLLMLDEPTNHLDLEATVWLEQWLKRYQGTLLLISHDRTFLDSIIDHVVHFENVGLDTYKGNYSAFEKQRALKMALQQALFEKQQRRREQIENFVRRFRVKATKARQAQSRLKELDRMQDIAPAHVDSPFRFKFPVLDHLPAFLMQLEKLCIGFDYPLVKSIDLGIRSESRIGLLGFNGSGKSTLLKVLAGQLEQLDGTIIRAKKLRVGYFAQHQVDELSPDATPVELLRNASSKRGNVAENSVQEIRDFLGGFDFRGSRVDETIANFSGGEKARLALAKLAWLKPNLLLLDEPTNHLDLEMCHALTVALQEYQGAMIVVSHDRHLLANTVDEFHSIHEGVFSEFKGTLRDYERWLVSTSRSNKSASKHASSVGGTNVAKKTQRQQAAAKRERLAPLRKKEKHLEAELERIHAELESIEQQLADESIYSVSEKTNLTKLLQQQGQLKSAITQKEEQWFKLQQELSEH